MSGLPSQQEICVIILRAEWAILRGEIVFCVLESSFQGRGDCRSWSGGHLGKDPGPGGQEGGMAL